MNKDEIVKCISNEHPLNFVEVRSNTKKHYTIKTEVTRIRFQFFPTKGSSIGDIL
jgi:hypothetical protein